MVDSDGNLYATSFYDPSFYHEITKKVGSNLQESLIKITTDGKISEFFIHDENNEVVNIFPKVFSEDKLSFTSNYSNINLLIKNDCLYTSYDYSPKSNEKGFLKLNLKDNSIKKYPQDEINHNLIVNNNNEIEYKYDNDNYVRINENNEKSTVKIDIPEIHTEAGSDYEIVKVDNKGKKVKIDVSTISDRLSGIKTDIYKSVTTSNGDIFFILIKFQYEKLEDHGYYYDNNNTNNLFVYKKTIGNYLYKITPDNKLYLLYDLQNDKTTINYPSIDINNMIIDEKRQIMYLSYQKKKSIYKIKL